MADAGHDLSELGGQRVLLRPLEAGDAEGLRAIRQLREVADRWGPLEADFPWEEPTAARLSILIGSELAGMIQFTEENERDYRHVEVDIFLAPAWHAQGHGTDAMTTLVDHLTTVRGHHRVILGTAIDNAAALRCYEKAGFRRVGVTKLSGRDFRTGEFADEWFMELVVAAPDTHGASRTP